MKTKTLYKIGPRGGMKKIGECPVNCDYVTVLGREARPGERFAWGKGNTEAARREYAQGGTFEPANTGDKL